MIALPILNDSLCARCTALCCNYVTIEIDKPRTKRQKDDIRWYLLHEGVTLLIEKRRWLLKFDTRCAALGPQNECTIYDRRPEVCRGYTTDNCDYHTAYENWDTDYQEIVTLAEYEQFLESRKRKPVKKSDSRTDKCQFTNTQES
jgi:Fe-S-cluster containining protein